MNIISSRLPALKFLGMFGVAQVCFTLYSNVNNCIYSIRIKVCSLFNNTWKDKLKKEVSSH